MAKEFDIYLNRRLTECDIIVYSIPYREGLTVMERLILETCLESYLLQKFVAVKTGSVLVSHIDEMIKTCYERLNHSVAISSSVDFKVQYALNPVPSKIEISSESIETLSTTFASAHNVLELSASSVFAQTKKPFGTAFSEIEVSSEVKGTLKNAMERADPQILPTSQLDGTNKLSILQVAPAIEPETTMVDLLYRIYATASGGISIAAATLATEIHFSLGSGSSQLDLMDVVVNDAARKYETVTASLDILSDLTETLYICMRPTTETLEFSGSVDSIVKRHRLLLEMDSDELARYDNMSLNDIDYVVLQG